MLKINKNQIVVGQKMVVDKPLYCKVGDNYLHDYDQKGFNVKDPALMLGTVLTLTSKPTSFSEVTLEDESGKKYHSFWSIIKNRTSLGDFPNLGANKIEYRLLLDGVDFKKKKFKDLGKVKASLLSMMGYHQKFATVAKQYFDRCPENQEGVYYVYETYDTLNRYQFGKLEVVEVINGKQGKKVDFDFVGYYDEMIKFLSVSAQFGPAARDCFKKALDKEDFKTIVVVVPKNYDTHDSYDYQYLKEDPEVKEYVKKSKVRGTIKSSKMGKTAIAFKSNSEAMKLTTLLPKDSFYVLNMNGEELIEKSEQFVIQQSRKEKLEKILENII